jgi:hypothetical protein
MRVDFAKRKRGSDPNQAWLDTRKNLSGRALAEANDLVRLGNPEGTLSGWVEAAERRPRCSKPAGCPPDDSRLVGCRVAHSHLRATARLRRTDGLSPTPSAQRLVRTSDPGCGTSQSE